MWRDVGCGYALDSPACLLPLPLRVPLGLHCTRHYTPGISFVVVVIDVVSAGSWHLKYIEHPDKTLNAVDEVW